MKTLLPKLIGALAAATLLGMPPVLAQTDEPWCGTDVDGAMNCAYRTPPDCEDVMRSAGRACVPNPDINYIPSQRSDDT